MKNLAFYFILGVSVLRGYLIFLNVPYSILYPATSLLIVLILCISTFRNYQKSLVYLQFKELNKLIFFNSILLFFYILSELFLLFFGITDVSDLETTSLYYLLLSPLIIYVYRDDFKIFDTILLLISFLVCISVIYEIKFYQIEGGYNLLIEYRQKFRSLEGIGLVGDNFQLAGVIGDHHDTANVLGMLSIFAFNNFLKSYKLSFLIIFFLLFISLLLTISTANILLVILTLFISLLFNRSFKAIFFVCVILFVFGYFSQEYVSVLFGFSKKFGSDSNSSAIIGFLTLNDFISGFFHLFFGHGTSFDISIIKSEIAFIKLLFGYGILHFIVIIRLILFPFSIWRKLNYDIKFTGEMLALFFGFISLLHYGSIFRISSIFIFFGFYTYALTNMAKVNKLKLM